MRHRSCLPVLPCWRLRAPSGSGSPTCRHFDDAPLHAVQFVRRRARAGPSATRASSGTPIDGGKTWERQPTGHAGVAAVVALPDAVHRLGRRPRGAAATAGSGRRHARAPADGGLKWQRRRRQPLPGLNRSASSTSKTGFVAGDGSDQFPTGVFVTTDGGRDVAAGRRAARARAGWPATSRDAADRVAGRRAGAGSAIAPRRRASAPPTSTRSAAARICGVASAGTASRRRRPGRPGAGQQRQRRREVGLRRPADCRADVLASCDFHGVALPRDRTSGSSAGPARVVLAQRRPRQDAGRSSKTGQPLPLNGDLLPDEQPAGLVGELGTILGTTDGGKTWKVQRPRRPAGGVLFVHARPHGLPLETVAAASAATTAT